MLRQSVILIWSGIIKLISLCISSNKFEDVRRIFLFIFGKRLIIDKVSVENLIQKAEKKLEDKNYSDKEKYIIAYKIETLKEISR